MRSAEASSAPALWEKLAHTATIASAVAAVAALAASIYQFHENLRVQERALSLQRESIQVERATKFGELFERYLKIHGEAPAAELSREQRSVFYVERNNRALLVLNAIYSGTKGDEEWETLVFNSLQRYVHVVRDKNIVCDPLTTDFRKFIELAIPDTTDRSMCSDYIDSN